jgi:hypothetical protein
MIPIFLLAVTITFRPPGPRVGDLITVEVPAQSGPVKLDPSPHFEVVSRSKNGVVIRTFEPKPLVLSGTAADERFERITIPIHSVLKKNDGMEPAPLRPPRKVGYPRGPFLAIGAAALAAIAAWAAVFLVARRQARAKMPLPVLSPVERFRAAVSAANESEVKWAALADATRAYLAVHGYGAELTTRELLARAPEEIRGILAEVLRRGDLEKFSPWGAPAGDFNAVALHALSLPEYLEPKPVAEAAA